MSKNVIFLAATNIWKLKHSVNDAELWSCPLVQILSANCWYWSSQWDNEQLIQIELCLEVMVQWHLSSLGIFLAEMRLLSSGWQQAISPAHMELCQRSLQRLCSFNPSWSELTWHPFISAKCSRGETLPLPKISKLGQDISKMRRGWVIALRFTYVWRFLVFILLFETVGFLADSWLKYCNHYETALIAQFIKKMSTKIQMSFQLFIFLKCISSGLIPNGSWKKKLQSTASLYISYFLLKIIHFRMYLLIYFIISWNILLLLSIS